MPRTGSFVALPSARRIAAAPLRAQTYRNLLYLLLAFPLGIAYVVFLSIGLSVGVSLLIAVTGIPILLFVFVAVTGLASIERKLTAFLLGVDIAPPSDHPLARDDRSVYARAKALVAGASTWKAIAYLASKVLFGVASFVAVTSLLVTAVSLLLVPLVYDQPHVTVGIVFEDAAALHPALSLGWGDLFVGFRGTVPLTSWEVTTLPEAVGVALLGAVLIVVALNLLNALAWLSGRYAKVMLGERGFEPVREAVAR